jgi:hypothetical protein
MATKQDIEKCEKEILELRKENKGYEAKLITLRQQKQKASDSERKNDLAAEIQFLQDRISANDRQLDEKEKRITAEITADKQQIILDKQIRLQLLQNQGKSAASTDSL